MDGTCTTHGGDKIICKMLHRKINEKTACGKLGVN